MPIKPINKKHATFIFNADWKKGGVFWNLSPRSARAVMILQAYCDDDGYICQTNGSGYTKKELADMFDMSFKTVKLVLTELVASDLIVVDVTDKVKLKHFQYNQGKRLRDLTKGSGKSTITSSIDESKLMQEEALKKQDETLKEIQEIKNKLNGEKGNG